MILRFLHGIGHECWRAVQACVRYDAWLRIRRLKDLRSGSSPEHFLEAVCAFMQQCPVPDDVLVVLINVDEAQVTGQYQLRVQNSGCLPRGN